MSWLYAILALDLAMGPILATMMSGDYMVDPPTIPTSHGQHDDVPAKASLAPPTTDLAIPTYFSRDNRLLYDPLGGAASSLARYMSDDSPINTPAPLVLQSLARRMADIWTSGSDSESSDAPALALAYRLAASWSDGEGSAPAQALQLADVWTDEEVSGTEATPAVTSGPAPAQALQLAEVWTDNTSSTEASDPADMWAPGSYPALSLADRWSSGSPHSNNSSMMDDDTACSQYTYGSQLVVSPSRITLDNSANISVEIDNHFPSSDNLVPGDTPVIPISRLWSNYPALLWSFRVTWHRRDSLRFDPALWVTQQFGVLGDLALWVTRHFGITQHCEVFPGSLGTPALQGLAWQFGFTQHCGITQHCGNDLAVWNDPALLGSSGIIMHPALLQSLGIHWVTWHS
ncbi:hypothetical protein BYT27DRAFT_7215802 [Phlegmacium glaucopus]|nr:hypothetical protein BYT27DRAFT_7215802 [Phlegmacium glaucopus]